MRSLRTALELLTCAPASASANGAPDRLIGSLLWFPVVGAAVGGVLGLAEWGLRAVTHDHALACGLVIALGLPITRGRPLRGLMVMTGALFAGRDPEGLAQLAARSQPTPFGLLAGIAALLLKYALLMALPGEARLGALLLAGGLSRAAIVWVCWRFPYANTDTGVAAWLAALAGARDLWLVLPVLALGSVLSGPFAAPGALAGAWLVTHGFAAWVGRVLRGVTAQTCEAAAEIGELGALAVIAGLAWYGWA